MSTLPLEQPDSGKVKEADRLMVLPIQYPALWSMYIQARDSFWLPREVNLSVDVTHWSARLSDDERHVLSRILAFFATADGIVADNLVQNFCKDVSIPEAKFFYGFQIMMENIHAETYALLLLHLIQDASTRASILQATLTVPSIASKNRWAEKWLNDSGQAFKERLVAFACVEGIFFSSSFAIIYWFKSRNLLPGLCHSNDLISRDEALHTDFACLLLKQLGDLPDPGVVKNIVEEAVSVEIAFVRESLPHSLPGLPVNDMCTYVEFVADQLLRGMGYQAVFGVNNPLPIMTMASMPGRTNFFERKNAEYRLPAASLIGMIESIFSADAFAR